MRGSRSILKSVAMLFGVLLAPTVVSGQSMQAATEKGAVWVANGLDDTSSIVDLDGVRLVATLPAGVNPHIFSASPDERIVYVVNAGSHDREPGAHGNSAAGKQEPQGMGSGGAGCGGGMAQGISSAHGAAAEGGTQALLGNSLWAFEAATGRVLGRVAVGQGPTHPVPSPDGRDVHVTNTDGDSVSVADTRSWTVTATIPGLPEPHDGALTPDGRLLYLATAGDNTLAVVDTRTLRVVKSFAVDNKPRGVVAGGANSRLAYVTNKADGTLTVIDVAAEVVKGTYAVGGGAHALRMSPDEGTLYVSLSSENAVAVVDAASGQVGRRIAVGRTPEQIDLSADGRRLVVSNNGDGTLTIIDTGRGRALVSVAVGNRAYGLQIAPSAPQNRMRTAPPKPRRPPFPRTARATQSSSWRSWPGCLPNGKSPS